MNAARSGKSKATRPPTESFRERDARQAALKVKAWTGGLCHDRKALGEERAPLPFEGGYVNVKPVETIESIANVVGHNAPPSSQDGSTERDRMPVDGVVAKSHENASTGRIPRVSGDSHEQHRVAG